MAVASVFVVGLVALLYRYRVAQLVAIERVRTRIATDLHDDIGASLSQIAILSELARGEADTRPETANTLDRIATTSRELVESMGDIVWAINPKRDRVGDLLQRMRHFASDTFTGRNIDFTFRAPDAGRDLALAADVRREVLLIFKEAVNNIARHAQMPPRRHRRPDRARRTGRCRWRTMARGCRRRWPGERSRSGEHAGASARD